jgi:DNA-binding NarL/FixJ family response regulator
MDSLLDTAAGAIASIESLRPDAVILDFRLRTGNGLEVIERVKRDPRSPLVMVLTNAPQDHYRQRCLAAGAESLFDKSTEFERVCGVVQHLAGGTRTI